MIVDGLVSNASIATYTADGFNSLEVTYVSGNAFIMTGFGTASVLSEPVSFNVPVELVDADGDAAAAALLAIRWQLRRGSRSHRWTLPRICSLSPTRTHW